ncbi:hypothetical protein ACWDR5_19375 [Streptomyces koyangensis]
MSAALRYSGPHMLSGRRKALTASVSGLEVGRVVWDWRGILLSVWESPDYAGTGLGASLVTTARSFRADLLDRQPGWEERGQ